MDKCPECNDKVGYYTVVTETINQMYNWQGEGIDATTVDTKEGRVKRCLGCNKIIKTNQLKEKNNE